MDYGAEFLALLTGADGAAAPGGASPLLRKATLCHGDGSRYSGEVDAGGRRCGAGVLHTARGDVLSGAWSGGAQHGAGVWVEAPRRVRGVALSGGC